MLRPGSPAPAAELGGKAGGDTVAVELAAHDWRGEVLVSLDVTVPARAH
jgi:hypothetical protein